jgi:triose/dihydroxyacetone kinase / FAD-AMP lyase (cyclizing)
VLCRCSLGEVYSVALSAASNLVSVSASLAHVHVPGRAPEMDEMNTSQEIEIGMGIHNEEGFGKVEKVYQNLS